MTWPHELCAIVNLVCRNIYLSLYACLKRLYSFSKIIWTASFLHSYESWQKGLLQTQREHTEENKKRQAEDLQRHCAHWMAAGGNGLSLKVLSVLLRRYTRRERVQSTLRSLIFPRLHLKGISLPVVLLIHHLARTTLGWYLFFNMKILSDSVLLVILNY